jgi:hypothetical protein
MKLVVTFLLGLLALCQAARRDWRSHGRRLAQLPQVQQDEADKLVGVWRPKVSVLPECS